METIEKLENPFTEEWGGGGADLIPQENSHTC